MNSQDDNIPANLIDLSEALLVVPPNLSGPEEQAITMLVEEVEKRTRIRWKRSTAWPAAEQPVVAVGPARALQIFAGDYAADLAADGETNAAEGYRIRVKNDGPAAAVFVIGNDARGVLFGIGHLLRTLRFKQLNQTDQMHHRYQTRITLPADLNITTAPHYPLRGHQLGYRDKTNSYCGWGLPQWEQYIRDLVVFGANAIELIPPRSDDKLDSVHFPLPPLEMMAGMSQLAADYGIDLWIWYPAMDKDYANPETVAFALEEWEQVFRALPRIDAIFVPGGDPGRTQPKYLMALLEKQTQNLQNHHPEAQMWLSPQGFTQEWLDEFIDIVRQEKPAWLTGLVHGPWVHMPMAEFRDLIPDQYLIRNYPDITHCLNCQFPVPDWDVAFALTVGREPINPRPLDEATIFNYSQPSTNGFLTYSEGCNDDVNKAIWSGLGWQPERAVIDILREYSRYFIGERYTDDFAQGLLALERNWRGPLAVNSGVYTTLHQFQAMEAAASVYDLKNWRFQQALYRAYYDAYIRSRLLYETGLEEQAMDQLRQAAEKGSHLAMAEAEKLLDLAVNQPISTGWRTRIFQLAEALFQSIHMQLSVPLYRGQREVRGANLDGVDYPLNNRRWLKAQFAALRKLEDEAEQLAGLKAITAWTNPDPGGFYDDLSRADDQSRLVKGLDYAQDPAFLQSPLRSFPYQKEQPGLRLSWRSYAGSLNNTPLTMRYTDLDPEARYKIRIIYSSINAHIPVRLEACLEANEGLEIHPLMPKKSPPAPVEFDIPPAAMQDGALTLRWYRAPGLGGTGRGSDVSEVWLIKT